MVNSVNRLLLKVVFILDDDEDILFILNYWLKDAGYDVHVFTNSKDMVQQLETYTPDIMLLNINLPSEDGREVSWHLTKIFPVSFYLSERTGKDIKQLTFMSTVAMSHGLRTMGFGWRHCGKEKVVHNTNIIRTLH